MPTTTTSDGVTLYYESVGSGETVVFVGEAGYGAWQWGWQHRRIAGPFEALVWDLRGTGRSDTPPGPYDVDTLARDLEAILTASDTPRVHLVGAGLGGMVALDYARLYDRVSTLTLFNAASSGSELDRATLEQLHASRDDPDGIRRSLSIAFTDSFVEKNPGIVEQVCQWRTEEDADAAGFDAQVDAMCSFDADALYEVTVPTLVCHGLEDPVVPFQAGKQLASELPRGVFEAVEGRHLCFVEHSRAVTDRLLGFLEEHANDRGT